MPDSTPDRDLWHAGYMTGLGEAFDFLLALPGNGKYDLLRKFHASLGIRGPGGYVRSLAPDDGQSRCPATLSPSN